MSGIARVNFTLYKAKALINLRYDKQSYTEGQILEIRESDIKELTDRKYVEMIELPEEKKDEVTPPVNIQEAQTTTPPIIDNKEEKHEEQVVIGEQKTEGGK